MMFPWRGVGLYVVLPLVGVAVVDLAGALLLGAPLLGDSPIRMILSFGNSPYRFWILGAIIILLQGLYHWKVAKGYGDEIRRLNVLTPAFGYLGVWGMSVILFCLLWFAFLLPAVLVAVMQLEAGASLVGILYQPAGGLFSVVTGIVYFFSAQNASDLIVMHLRIRVMKGLVRRRERAVKEEVSRWRGKRGRGGDAESRLAGLCAAGNRLISNTCTE